MRCRAVMFDLDGTLLDTIEDLAESMNAVLMRLGLPVHGVAAYKRFVGDGVERLVRRALPEGRRGDADVAAGVDAMLREYGARWDRKTRPYPGVAAMLDGLAARGIPVSILSNKPDAITRLSVGRLLSSWTFAAVRGAIDGVPKKPDPEGALRIAGELGIPPADFVYCGDTNTDMRTAVAAGMVPVGVLWGFRDAEELGASGARLLLRTPEDLLSAVG